MAVSKEGLLNAAVDVAKATFFVSAAIISPIAGIAGGLHVIAGEVEAKVKMDRMLKEDEETLTRLEQILKEKKG